MNEESLFGQLQFARNGTLSLLNSVTEEEADVVPNGFKNNIRWHLGHIYVVTENIAFGSVRLHRTFPDGYEAAFGRGTSPAEWSDRPATLPELEHNLINQINRIRSQLASHTGDTLPTPFQLPNGPEWTTLHEMINFSLYHEAMHAGLIKGLRYVVKA